MKRIIFILIFLIGAALIFVPGALADSGSMQTANALYENGRYAEAIRAYEQLAGQGVADANLYYNLGNAYYQSGDLGHAVLNYRRAAQLAPRDADIQYNLALARQQTGLPSPTPDTAVTIFLADMAAWLTLNETAVLSLTLWTLLCLLVLSIRRRQDGRLRTSLKYSLIPVTLLLALSIFTLGSRLNPVPGTPNAVIVAPSADLLAGPGNDFGSDGDLPGGAEVTLFQTRADWVQIGLPDAATRHWVSATTVELIN